MIPRSHRKEMWAEEWQKQNSLYSCLIPPKNLSHFNNLIWRDWGQRTTWFPQSHSFTWPCRLQSGSARLSSPAPTWLTDGCEPALTDHWRGKPSAPQERHKLQVTATGGSETSAGCSDRREIYLSVCRSVWDCRTPRVTEMIWRKCICIRRNTLRFRNLVLIHLPDTNETHPELTGTFLTLSFEVYVGNISSFSTVSITCTIPIPGCTAFSSFPTCFTVFSEWYGSRLF